MLHYLCCTLSTTIGTPLRCAMQGAIWLHLVSTHRQPTNVNKCAHVQTNADFSGSLKATQNIDKGTQKRKQTGRNASNQRTQEFLRGRPRGGDNFTSLFQVLQTLKIQSFKNLKSCNPVGGTPSSTASRTTPALMHPLYICTAQFSGTRKAGKAAPRICRN